MRKLLFCCFIQNWWTVQCHSRSHKLKNIW